MIKYVCCYLILFSLCSCVDGGARMRGAWVKTEIDQELYLNGVPEEEIDVDTTHFLLNGECYRTSSQLDILLKFRYKGISQEAARTELMNLSRRSLEDLTLPENKTLNDLSYYLVSNPDGEKVEVLVINYLDKDNFEYLQLDNKKAIAFHRVSNSLWGID